MDINNNRFYKVWLRDPYNYLTGAVLLSIFQIVTFATTGNPLGITSYIAHWGAWLYGLLGGSIENWYYFNNHLTATTDSSFLAGPGSIRNIGIVIGALLASLLSSLFRIKQIKSTKQVIGVIVGGLLMGYGAIIGLGCNIGALYGGIASLSLSGWVYGFFLFLGAIVGSKILLKFFV